MFIDYKILDKNSIHISFDSEGLKTFLELLKKLLSNNQISIDINNGKFKNKNIKKLSFVIKKDTGLFSVKNGAINFEADLEDIEEGIEIVERAIVEKSFRTPEFMSFYLKSKVIETLTLYMIYDI